MTTRAPAPSLLRFGAATAPTRRLICFPFAGGGPAIYRLWTQGLPSDVEVLVPPSRRPGEAPLDSIAAMVHSLVPAVEAATDLPYALFGHSMGALMAFEMALALEAGSGPAPSHLFVSGRRSPHEIQPPTINHDLPDDEFLTELERRYAAVPAAVRREPDLLALLLPALRADIRATETYERRSDDIVRCPVRVYGGSEDRHPRPEQLPAWQHVAEQPVHVRVFPGDHFFLTAQRDALTADIVAHWSEAAVPAERR